ncbi:MAG: Ig-like domain repeat protein [Methanobrevibacter sp.]|nr:Ig-like domain repeat protein [Methanobrevibacter sp.]
MKSENNNIDNEKIIKIFSAVFVIFTILVIFSSLTTGVFAADFYVNTTGDDSSSSGNITDPYKNIGKAVNMTNDGEGNDKIIIDQGTYKGDGNVGITINQSVNIFGAKYIDSSKNDTIIDAEGNNFIFAVSKEISVNFYGIVFKNAVGSSDGTITDLTASGGAIFINNATVNIFNCEFINNTATGTGRSDGGGAVYVYDANVGIFNSIFVNNTATGTGGNNGGGALHQWGDSSILVVDNCTFENNRASNGGAIFARGSTGLTISNSTFVNNNATGTADDRGGGAIYQSGGGEFSLNSSTFNNNIATRGGALFIRANHPTVQNVTGCTFIDNTAEFGSAIYRFQSIGLNISYCIFLNNTGYQVYNMNTTVDSFFVADFNWWGSNNVTDKYGGFELNNYFIAVLRGNAQFTVNNNYGYTYLLALNGTNTYNSNAINLPDFEVSIVHPDGTTQIVNGKNAHTWSHVPVNANPIVISSTIHGEELNLRATVFVPIETHVNPTSISVSGFTSFYGKNVLLTATVNPNVASAVGKTVKFYINGIHVGSGKVDSKGIATFNYKSNFVGKRTLTAVFEGDSTKLNSRGATVTVTKSKVSSVITSFAGKFNKKGSIKATFRDQNKKALSKKTVKFYIKGKYVGKAKTNSKGVATLNLKKVNFRGKVNIVAKYAGDKLYSSSKTTKRVNIKR